MSRINAGIPVAFLTDEHLRAEHREIKRICALYQTRNGKLDKACSGDFTLGEGHLLFFLNKGLYTKKRFFLLHDECALRGFNMTDFSDNWKVFKPEHNQDWVPTKKDSIKIINRITESLRTSKDIPHYYSNRITVDEAVKLIRNTLL